jgi:hypothetical protein
MSQSANNMISYCTIEQTQDLCFDLLTIEEIAFLQSKMVVVNYKAEKIFVSKALLQAI